MCIRDSCIGAGIGIFPFGLIALQICFVRKGIFAEMLEHIIKAVYNTIFQVVAAAPCNSKSQT